MTSFVKLYTDTCVPCKMIEPVFQRMKSKFEGRGVVFESLNASNPDIQQRFSVTTVPTFISFKDGVEIERTEGVINVKDMELKIERLLN